MSATFVLEGMPELLEALRKLPEEMGEEITAIVETRGNAAVRDIKAGYKPSAGDVREKVSVTVERGQFSAVAKVKNAHNLAFIFEKGTEARHYVTKNGVQHATGKMPPAHAFIPPMARHRRLMWQQFKDLLIRKGLIVSETGGE